MSRIATSTRTVTFWPSANTVRMKRGDTDTSGSLRVVQPEKVVLVPESRAHGLKFVFSQLQNEHMRLALEE